MVKKRIASFFLILIVFVILAGTVVSAEEAESIPCEDEYREMLEALPDDIAELLPDKLFSGSVTDIAESASQMADFGYIVNVVLKYLGLELKSSVRLLAVLVGILLLAAALNTAKTYFSSSAISDAFSVCASCAVFLTAVSCQLNIISSVSAFFSRITTLVNSLIPLMGALYAMGGNITGAVVNHSSLMIFMLIVENLCAGTAMPVSGICISFSAISALAPGMGIGGISTFFKKMYTGALSFTMTVFTTVMAAQSLLASKTDSLAGKAAKFAMGNMIPLVGSALAGTLGTITTSVEYIRAGVGVVGVVVVVLLVLPTVITLLVTKYVFSLSCGIADILGCGAESKLISELSGINSFLMAISCVCSVVLIFMLTLFAKCSAATVV